MRNHGKYLIIGALTLCCLFSFPALCQQAGGDLRRLTLPGNDWSVDLSVAGLEVTQEEINTESHTYDLAAFSGALMTHPEGVIMLEARIEPLPKEITDVGVRDYAVSILEKTKSVKKGSITTSDYNGIPIIKYQREFEVAYNITKGFGVNIPQQTLDAYLTKDNSWIIIRLSDKSLKDSDVNLFHTILDSVKVVDNTRPTSSFDFYSRGRSLYLQKNYVLALNEFNAALKLELEKRQLALAQWRGLVANIADSCGATGNIAAAKAALEYGVKNDPTYPTFHLGLARLYAFLGDLDNTITELGKAFTYKENRSQTAPLPDPMFDRAFERFKKDNRFRKAVAAMKK